MVGGFVVPDGGGEGEDALQDAGADALGFASAVAFEVELGFEGFGLHLTSRDRIRVLSDHS